MSSLGDGWMDEHLSLTDARVRFGVIVEGLIPHLTSRTSE